MVGRPNYARLTVPNLSEDQIPESLTPFIQSTKEHLLSVLRLTYDFDLHFFSRPIWFFVKTGEAYNSGLNMQIKKYIPAFNAELFHCALLGKASLNFIP